MKKVNTIFYKQISKLLYMYFTEEKFETNNTPLELIRKCNKCNFKNFKEKKIIFPRGTYESNLIIVADPFWIYEEKLEEEINILFRKMFNAINIPLEKTYITFSIKCFNKSVKSNIDNFLINCREVLLEELKYINPKTVITFGKYSSSLIFDDMDISNIRRNNFYSKYNTKIISTYHPGDFIKNKNLKVEVWEDLKLLKRVLES